MFALLGTNMTCGEHVWMCYVPLYILPFIMWYFFVSLFGFVYFCIDYTIGSLYVYHTPMLCLLRRKYTCLSGEITQLFLEHTI